MLSRFLQGLLFLVDFPEKLADYDREISTRWWSWCETRLADPSLCEPLFIARLTPHVERVWTALREGRPESLRALVSDGLYQGLLAQRDFGEPFEEVAHGRAGIESVNPDALRRGPAYEVAVVRPYWNREPAVRDLSWAVGGKWFFLRRTGARTRDDGKGLWESQCPDCGAPLEIADRVQCPYCSGIVNSGAHDWILTSIHEAEHEYEIFTVPGADELRRRDPGFTVEAVEDRIVAMFWSLRRGDGAALRRFVADNATVRASGAPEGRPFLEDVRIQAVEPGTGVDRLIARVRWRVGPHVTIPWSSRDTPEALQFKARLVAEDYVLTRDARVQTPLARGLNSLGCKDCGAPLGESSTCAHCGTAQPPSADWVLAEVKPHEPRSLPQIAAVPASYDLRTCEHLFAILNDLAESSGAGVDTYVWRSYLARAFRFGKWRRQYLRRSADAARGLDPSLRPVLFGLAVQMFADAGAIGEKSAGPLQALASVLEIPVAERDRAFELARALQERVAALPKKKDA